jgi:hypothetical protein
VKFLDAALVNDDASAMVQALQIERADAFTYYVGGNFALHAWAPAAVQSVRDAGYPGMGIYVSTVVGRSGQQDGVEAASLAQARGARAGDRLAWDLEPQIYRATPNSAFNYGVGWAAQVQQLGFSPVIYCTPDGVAAIGDKGFDAVWAAVPGNSDPSSVFDPRFFPGNVAVQYGSGQFAGVDYDTNISEFSFVPVFGPPIVTARRVKEADSMWQSPPLSGTQDFTAVSSLTPDGKDVNGTESPEAVASVWLYIKALVDWQGQIIWTRDDGTPGLASHLTLKAGAHGRAVAPMPFDGGVSVQPDAGFEAARYVVGMFRSAWR